MMRSPDPHLIVTIDYEVFGDGSGCLSRCVLDPCERILAIAERHGFAVTLFVEALELARIEEAPRSPGEAELVARVKSQVASAVERGHAAELHLHPQWLTSSREADGTWRLDLEKWRMGDLDAGDVRDAVARGTSWLERVAGRPPIAFRAGAWCIQPFERVVPALLEHGIEIDSTVAPGLRNAASGDWFDFRFAEGRGPWWRFGEKGGDGGNGGNGNERDAESGSLIEVPIAVGRVSRVRNLRETLRRKASRESDLAPGCEGSYAGPNSCWQRLLGKLSKLASLGRSMLDISTTSAEIMTTVCRQWIDRHGTRATAIPIVGIGHTKNFTDRSAANFDRFLGWASESGLSSSTYATWLRELTAAEPKLVADSTARRGDAMK